MSLFDDAPYPFSWLAPDDRVVNTILGPLLNTNPDEREMLLTTLVAFFAFQGSAIGAGKHLYRHPNGASPAALQRVSDRRLVAGPRSSAELFVALEALRRLPEPTGGYA